MKKPVFSHFAFTVACAVVFALIAVHPSFATIRYIAQSAGVFAGGTACKGQIAITPTTFNGTTNSPGDVNYICGTITGGAGSNLVTVHGSGSSGSPVTIIFDNGAVLQAPYFSASTYGINGNDAQWIVIDGGTNGTIQNTANGTGITYQRASTLVGGFGSNFTVKNLSFLNVYRHTSGDANGAGAWGLSLKGETNVTVGPNNTFTYCDVCIMGDWSNSSDSNWAIQGNFFAESNQDIQLGFYPAGTFSNLSIYGNKATNWANWDDAGDNYHHNFVHLFTNLPGANLTGNLWIYNNSAVGDIGSTATSLIFLENNNGGSGGTMGPVYIFNNVLSKTNANVPSSEGIVTVMSTGGYLLNNTISDAGGTGSNAYNCTHFTNGGWTMENNVLVGCGSYIYQQSTSMAAVNDNVYYGATSPQWISQSTWDTTLASWRTSCSCDASSVTTSPNLDTNYRPQPGSSAIGLGANLSSLGITPLDSDLTGSTRQASGAWIAGAYSTSASSGPNAPVGLIATVQ